MSFMRDDIDTEIKRARADLERALHELDVFADRFLPMPHSMSYNARVKALGRLCISLTNRALAEHELSAILHVACVF